MDTVTTSATAKRRADGTEATLRGWAPSLIAIAICAIGFGVVFSHEVGGAVRVWLQSTAYNHCFLVLPLAAFLLWERRAILPELRPQPTIWPLLIVPVLAVMWVGAAILDILEGEQLVMVALFEIIIFSLLGRRTFVALLGPLLFLFFLVPFGGFLVPWLQQVTTQFAVAGLRLVHIPVFANGFVIEIPEGVFEVAEACAGLRFLIASLVFGCFFAMIVYRSPWRRLVFVALSVVVPVVANGMRAFGLIGLAHIAGSATAVATDHVLYGWLFFTLVTLLLIVIGIGFRDRRAAPTLQPALLSYPPPTRSALIGAGGLLLAIGAPIGLGFVGSTAAAAPTLTQPSALGNMAWTREGRAATPWRPAAPEADRQLVATYRNGPSEVTEFVGLYRLRLRNGRLTATVDRVSDGKIWQIAARGRDHATAHGATVSVNTVEIIGDGGRRLVWWFYKIGDRMTASMLDAKLLQARAILSGDTHFGEFVAISTPVRASLDQARARLSDFLKALPAAQG